MVLLHELLQRECAIRVRVRVATLLRCCMCLISTIVNEEGVVMTFMVMNLLTMASVSLRKKLINIKFITMSLTLISQCSSSNVVGVTSERDTQIVFTTWLDMSHVFEFLYQCAWLYVCGMPGSPRACCCWLRLSTDFVRTCRITKSDKPKMQTWKKCVCVCIKISPSWLPTDPTMMMGSSLRSAFFKQTILLD